MKLMMFSKRILLQCTTGSYLFTMMFILRFFVIIALLRTTSRVIVSANSVVLDSNDMIMGTGNPTNTKHSNQIDSNGSSRNVENDELLPWYTDFLTLPSDVPWPGAAWLDRINNNIIKIAKELNTIDGNSTSTSTITTTSQQSTNSSSSATIFTWEGIEYNSVYAALLQNEPLQYPCRNFNAYLNSIFISNDMAVSLVQMTQSLERTHYIICYIRNFIGAMIVYYGTAGIFHYFCYIHPISHVTFAKRIRPSTSTIINQITLAQGSLFLYVLLPVVDEYVVEQGWTRTYFTISEIGGIHIYVLMLVLYFALVEIGIYWMHRTLHTNKFLYKYIHMKHHQYNKPETLTPWASIAFHPLDGILQASPYFVVIFFVPCHYFTHVIMLFFTAIWATYIHDAMDWNINPIMGSKYHTVHHTHYIYNYGQVFTFCDYIWGTLRVPLEPTGSTKQRLLKMD